MMKIWATNPVKEREKKNMFRVSAIQVKKQKKE